MTVFNVMNAPYSAANNNSANDATAINAAIAAANAAGGGIVYFPAGAGYKVNSALTPLGAGVTLEGEGWKKSVIRANFASGDTVSFGTGASGGGEMNGVKMLGFDPMVTRTSGAEIRSIQGLSTYIDEVKVMNVSGIPHIGIWYSGNGGYKQYLNRTECNGCGTGLQIGTLNAGDNPINIFVDQCEFSACVGPGVRQYGGFVTISNTEALVNGGEGILVYPSHANAVASVVLRGWLSDTNNGDGLKAGGTAGKAGINIKDSWFSNNGNVLNSGHTAASVGINLGELVSDYDIQGSQIVFNGGDGCALYASGLGIFDGNTILCNGQFATTTGYSGVYVKPGHARAILRNNYADPGDVWGGVYPAKQAYGFYISTSLFLFAFHGNMSVGHTGANYQMGTSSIVPVQNYENF